MNVQRKRGAVDFPAWIRSVACVLAVVFGLHGMVPMAGADILPSAMVTSEEMREADVATIQRALEQKVVRHRLEELGFTVEEIEERVAYASDEELHQLAVRSEDVMAGGSGVVEVLLVVLLVLLILRLVSLDEREMVHEEPRIMVA